MIPLFICLSIVIVLIVIVCVKPKETARQIIRLIRYIREEPAIASLLILAIF